MGRPAVPAGIFLSMKTYSPKPRDIERRWYVLDASGAVLGRLATEAAAILRGKHKPIFAPHMDTGDHVIVVNAKQVQLTGGKEQKKVAYRHSGYPGGLNESRYDRLLAERPAYAVEKAIKGMLPHNRLGRQMASKLRVYADADHRHHAQQPKPLRLGEVPPWDGLPVHAAEPEQPKQKPEPKAPAAKRSTAKRAAAKPSSSASPAKRSTASSSKSSKSAAKRTTSKSTAKRTSAKRTTSSKAPASKKTTARAPKKKEA
jgi:large subunit ribosomal protein L13